MPPPQAGRESSSSGRESVRSRTGRPCRRAARSSIRSRSAGSAQWMSSNTNAVASSRAPASMKTRTDWKRLSRSGVVVFVSNPSRIARCPATASASSVPTSRSTSVRSFPVATSTSSLSKMPASSFTCAASAPYALRSRYGRQRPLTTRPPRDAMRTMNSAASRDLPTPGGPRTVMRWGRRSSSTRSHVASSRPISRSRPTNGVVERSRSPSAEVAPSARHAEIGFALPFAVTGSTGSYSMAARVARYVSAPTMISPTGACCCRRDAVFTTSPATIASPSAGRAESVTTASPVFTAPRIRSSSSGWSALRVPTASRTARAALTARSGSSPWAVGAPKTAMTASPTNFSTTPPNDSSSSRTVAWYGVRIARTSSGSSRSERDVNPTRSTKTTLTIRRSSRSAVSSPSGAPHARQKRAISGFSCPQERQMAIPPSWQRSGSTATASRRKKGPAAAEPFPTRAAKGLALAHDEVDLGVLLQPLASLGLLGDDASLGPRGGDQLDLADGAEGLLDRELRLLQGLADDVRHDARLGDELRVHGHVVGRRDRALAAALAGARPAGELRALGGLGLQGHGCPVGVAVGAGLAAGDAAGRAGHLALPLARPGDGDRVQERGARGRGQRGDGRGVVVLHVRELEPCRASRGHRRRLLQGEILRVAGGRVEDRRRGGPVEDDRPLTRCLVSVGCAVHLDEDGAGRRGERDRVVADVCREAGLAREFVFQLTRVSGAGVEALPVVPLQVDGVGSVVRAREHVADPGNVAVVVLRDRPVVGHAGRYVGRT